MTNKKSLKVGNVTVERGEKKVGVLATFDMRDGFPTKIPVLVANGAEEGHILASTCGVHANEPLGTMGIIDVFKMLDPAEMTGAYIGVPMITSTAFHHGWRYNPLDLETARLPGNSKGNISARMANAVFKEVYEPSDIYLAWHSNFIPCLAWISGRSWNDEDVNILSEKIAKASGMTYINGPGVQPFPPVPRPGQAELPPSTPMPSEPPQWARS